MILSAPDITFAMYASTGIVAWFIVVVLFAVAAIIAFVFHYDTRGYATIASMIAGVLVLVSGALFLAHCCYTQESENEHFADEVTAAYGDTFKFNDKQADILGQLAYSAISGNVSKLSGNCNTPSIKISPNSNEPISLGTVWFNTADGKILASAEVLAIVKKTDDREYVSVDLYVVKDTFETYATNKDEQDGTNSSYVLITPDNVKEILSLE